MEKEVEYFEIGGGLGAIRTGFVIGGCILEGVQQSRPVMYLFI